MRLSDLVDRRRVVASLRAQGKTDVLDELSALLSSDAEGIEQRDFARTLAERERLRSTGVGSGVAIPHGKVPGLARLRLAVGISRDGVDFDAPDGEPVHIFMALAAPVSSTGDHLKALARIARLCGDTGFRARLLECETDEAAYTTIIREDEAHQ